jgi:hypothetical protein
MGSGVPRMTEAEVRAYLARMRKADLAPEPATAEPCPQGQESKFQRDAETWLEGHGYWRINEKNLDASEATGQAPRGWQYHLAQPQGNPTLLDLTIYGNDGRYLMIELKTAKGRVRKGQRQLLAALPGCAVLCRNLPEVIEAVEAWEGGRE